MNVKRSIARSPGSQIGSSIPSTPWNDASPSENDTITQRLRPLYDNLLGLAAAGILPRQLSESELQDGLRAVGYEVGSLGELIVFHQTLEQARRHQAPTFVEFLKAFESTLQDQPQSSSQPPTSLLSASLPTADAALPASCNESQMVENSSLLCEASFQQNAELRIDIGKLMRKLLSTLDDARADLKRPDGVLYDRVNLSLDLALENGRNLEDRLRALEAAFCRSEEICRCGLAKLAEICDRAAMDSTRYAATGKHLARARRPRNGGGDTRVEEAIMQLDHFALRRLAHRLKMCAFMALRGAVRLSKLNRQEFSLGELAAAHLCATNLRRRFKRGASVAGADVVEKGD